LTDGTDKTRGLYGHVPWVLKQALEQYKAVVNFDGGDLEKSYNKLNADYEDSEQAAKAISLHIDSVEDVAEDLFEEWEDELAQIQNHTLQDDSAKKLHDTCYKHQKMVKSMH